MEYLAHIADDGREQTVGEHLRSAAEYASRALAPAGLCEAGYLCALLHDCGKYTELFDRYIHSNGEMRRGSVNHTFSGVRLIMERCHNEPPASTRDIFGELLAYAVGAHHGEFDIADEDGKNGFFHRMKKDDIGYEEAVRNYTELCADTEELDRRFKAACDEATPIFDRITDIAADNSEVSFYVGMLSRLLLSAVIEGDRRDTAEFMSGVKRKDDEIPDWNELLDSVEKKILDLPANTPVNVARRNISEQCRLAAEAGSGVYRLNVPTGAGKTLSALRYALAHAAKNGMRRVIFTSPLLSILDQNAEVIREFVGDDSLILEHHSNVVRDSADGEALDKYELLAENWSAPIIITTMVQLLNTLFSDKTSCIRRFQALCGSVIVIDEVQTGIGRTGSLFAFQQFGIQPDVVSFAKGIAGGLPLGGILTNEKCAGVLTPGTHGSTFGANPVSTAAGLAVLETMDQPFLDQVREKGAYLRAGIQAIGSPELGDVVGMGLMLGIDVKGPRTNKELAALLIDHGLLCLTAGDRLRLLPPLVITKEEMDEGLAILKQTLMG